MSPHEILNNVARYSLEVGLLVGLAGFVPAAFRLRLPAVKLAFWHFLLAACLILPLVRPWSQSVLDIGIDAAAPAVALPATAAPLPPAPRYSQADILLALLAAGAVVRLGWLAVGLWRLRRYRLHSTPARWAQEHLPPSASGLSRPVDLRLSEDVSSPVTFGFLRPVVLLPSAFPDLDPAIREAVLAHEFLHVRRRDWLVTLAEEVVRAALWFHPAIWWLLGETQLAREQTVDRASVEMTRNREEYVDALLAIAGAQPRLDLAPAPLFLRKRHLRHRVVSLLKEVGMSKKHVLSALAGSLCVLAAAVWLATATFPLAAAPQVVADEPGVTVDLGGAALMHRTPVAYPEAARKNHIEGTVLVQATVDSAGNVTDASVLSGPEELRKTAIQAVLQWHFVKGGSSAKTVTIAFQIPKVVEQELPAPVAAPGGAVSVQGANPPVLFGQLGVTGGTVQRMQITQGPQGPQGSPEYQALMAQQQQLAQQMSDALRSGGDQQAIVQQYREQMMFLTQQRMALMKIRAITVRGLSDSVRDQLLATLPVHVGDAPTQENMSKLREAVKEFDEHLTVSQVAVGLVQAGGVQTGGGPDEVEVLIQAPGANLGAGSGGPRINVGGAVQQSNLIRQVQPVYPPLARSTRIQGSVILNVVIGKDGSVVDALLISGHPLLAPAAIDAVKQWQYKPTLLNDQPVEVQTQVTVNFTLSDSAPIVPIQQ
jgi:TonB family protein